MNIQSMISSSLNDIVTTLVGVLVAFAVAYIKQHFSATQISTGAEIASEAVNFAAQAAKKLGITQDSAKYTAALAKAKELASKAGLKLTDSQWETLLESAYKQVKDGMQPLQAIADTTPALTQDDITNMIKTELSKVAPSVPADPQIGGNAPVVVDSGVVTPAQDSIGIAGPKPITEVIQETINQVGEQAKTQAVHDLTSKFAAVVQEAVAPPVA